MTSLDDALRAAVRRAEDRLPIGDGGMSDALYAVIDEHAGVDDGSGYGDRLVCRVCCDPEEGWDHISLQDPCPTKRKIAEQLGVDLTT